MWAYLLLFVVGTAASAASLPQELADALQSFRADPPAGWSFTQSTSATGQSTVERSDAARTEFDRWTLIEKDGRAPTPDELRQYADNRSRRSRGGTAPKLVDRFDLDSVETLTQTPERATYRLRLRTGEAGDKTAAFLRATLVVHKPTRTIESIELGSVSPFSPTLGVKIEVMRTVMTYSPPHDDVPSLPQKVATHVRGTAFWFKSLDADMTVTFTDYVNARKK